MNLYKNKFSFTKTTIFPFHILPSSTSDPICLLHFYLLTLKSNNLSPTAMSQYISLIVALLIFVGVAVQLNHSQKFNFTPSESLFVALALVYFLLQTALRISPVQVIPIIQCITKFLSIYV